MLLLMEEILHQLVCKISDYLQSFILVRWCRISFINSSIPTSNVHWQTFCASVFSNENGWLAIWNVNSFPTRCFFVQPIKKLSDPTNKHTKALESVHMLSRNVASLMLSSERLSPRLLEILDIVELVFSALCDTKSGQGQPSTTELSIMSTGWLSSGNKTFIPWKKCCIERAWFWSK